jgi:hypothetical protein
MDGSVVEFIGLDDFNIEINGRLTGKYLEDLSLDVELLKVIMDYSGSIKITSKHLQNLGINNLIIASYGIPQNEGGITTQYFTINAISDSYNELYLDGDNQKALTKKPINRLKK